MPLEISSRFVIADEELTELDAITATLPPEGRQAGSSFSNCVVKLVRQTRFKKARKDSVHTAKFKL